ncbi:MAG: high-potential iron-sulfur protein [Saprospiraceae bacterium]|nr:high-potential iron-sulfur protein [Saprospiraceae bacterium]
MEVSPLEESSCQNCNLWLPSQNDLPCGGCTLFAGPVAAEGYCTYWAPQVEG